MMTALFILAGIGACSVLIATWFVVLALVTDLPSKRPFVPYIDPAEHARNR